MRAFSLVPALPPIIEKLEKKPGKDWTPEERAACREWLFSAKWNDLLQEFQKNIEESPADHRSGVLATFLNGKLDRVLAGYKVGYRGIWPYVVVCLRRHCWKAAKDLSLERKLTREMAEGEEASRVEPLDREKWTLLPLELSRLKPDYQEPLLLLIRGASYEEIAVKLEIPIALVKIRIFRGRQELRKALGNL